jgi:hypothetical protein
VGGGLFIQRAMRMRNIFICGLSCYATFVHIIQSTARFSGKKITEYKMCFDSLYNLVLNISHSKKNSARYSYKCINVFIQSTRYSCKLLMKLEISRQVFEKYSNVWKFFQWESSYSMRMDRQTDRHDEANSRYPKFCERAQKKHKQTNSGKHYATRQNF